MERKNLIIKIVKTIVGNKLNI